MGVELEPDLAFVVDDGTRAVGYIVGTKDTPAFVERYRSSWLPRLSSRHPAPTREPQTPSQAMIHLMHRPERLHLPEPAAHPAHSHIDLLPRCQRGGHGRELMAVFPEALRRLGVEAVHLGMVSSNTGARAFHDRLDFHPITVPEPGALTCLGRRSTPFEQLPA